MPAEPEELTDDEIALLRIELEQSERRLIAAMEAGAEGTRPVDLDEPIGRVSRIDALAQREMNEAGRRAQKRQLTEVRLALEAMKHGDFGMCRACDGPVGFRRLKARPSTQLCLSCQSERERG